jgi:hypothetical protein
MRLRQLVQAAGGSLQSLANAIEHEISNSDSAEKTPLLKSGGCWRHEPSLYLHRCDAPFARYTSRIASFSRRCAGAQWFHPAASSSSHASCPSQRFTLLAAPVSQGCIASFRFPR